MKRLVSILAFLTICIQLFAKVPLSKDAFSSKTIYFQNLGDRYLLYFSSLDKNPNIANHSEKLVLVFNNRDSVFLEKSMAYSHVFEFSGDNYSSHNAFEVKFISALLNKRITKVLIQLYNGSFETYNIADEYQKEFSNGINREIYAAKTEYDEESSESNLFWWFVYGTIGILLFVAIVYKLSNKTSKSNATTNKLKPTVKSIPPQESEPKTLIDQGQYYYICKFSKELQKLFWKISEDEKLLSSANDKSISAGGEGISSAIFLYDQLRYIFIKDLRHCFEEMGYSFYFTTQTAVGQCLYVISSASQISPIIANVSYGLFDEKVNSITSKELAEERESFEYWEKCGEVDFPLKVDDEFKISSLLLSCNGNNDDLRLYRVLLYKLVSILIHVNDENEEKKQALLDRIRISYEEMSNKELSKLIGLQPVKEEVQTLSNFIVMRQKRKEMGLTVPDVSYHLVFTGNPGTGKTTVARILAGIFHDKGVLKKGHLVETDRSGLVAEYVGQTAVKTNKIIDKALDGVLFIDEAYSLIAQGEDFGQEAVATLLKRMEDDRDRLIVILAGYTEEMEEFINSNPGLRSRFNRYIFFPDYSAEELAEIFFSMAKKHEYTMSDEVKQFIINKLEDIVANKPKDFGNARYVRNLFERVVQSQANRLAKESNLSKGMLTEITIDDIK